MRINRGCEDGWDIEVVEGWGWASTRDISGVLKLQGYMSGYKTTALSALPTLSSRVRYFFTRIIEQNKPEFTDTSFDREHRISWGQILSIAK